MASCIDCGCEHTRRSKRCQPCAYKACLRANKKWRAGAGKNYGKDWRAAHKDYYIQRDRTMAAKIARAARGRTPKARAWRRDWANSYYAQPEQKERRRARDQVARAVRAGRLIPPVICDNCGLNPGRGADGRRLIRADHHHGYDEAHWLDVRWLCMTCDGVKERKHVLAS